MGSPTGGFVVAIVVALAAAFLCPNPAAAGCTTTAEQRDFSSALRSVLVCAAQSLRRDGDRDCTAIAPPACGAAELAQVVDLLGGLPSAAVGRSPQLRCQIAAYRAAMEFVTRRVKERRFGHRRQWRSRNAVRLANQCTLFLTEVADGPLPRFGGRCAALVDPPDGFLFGTRASACLRPALEETVSSLLELPPVAPNVVLVITDDQRADSLHVMPNVQALAQQGVSFANAFTTTPICAPARAGLLTGLQAPAHGVHANLIPDGMGGATDGAITFHDSSTLATWFQAAGYRTGHFGKYLNGYSYLSPAIPPGWDDWRVFVSDTNNFFDYDVNENGVVRSYGSAPEDYSTDVIAGFAQEFVQANADVPFLMVLTPYAPHGPSTPAPRHAGSLAFLPLWRPPAWGENIADKPNWFNFFAVNSDSALIAHDAQIQRQRESLRAVDEAVAALSAQLEALGLTDNTIFVFVSDHGLHWGEHRWIGKQTPYEESIRIPLVIRYPLRVDANDVRPQFALNLDLAPTLAELADVEPGHAMDGRSLLDALDDAADWRRDFAVEHFIGGFTVPPWKLLRTERYKYVRHNNGTDELYDLAEDPYEMDNVAGAAENAILVAELSTRLDEVLAP
jgi:arylsulfatase A-like enzyme